MMLALLPYISNSSTMLLSNTFTTINPEIVSAEIKQLRDEEMRAAFELRSKQEQILSHQLHAQEWLSLSMDDAPQCTIYCDGPVLKAIQNANIFPDSKTFVDMPLKYDPEVIMESFNNLPNHDADTLRKFLDDNFLPSGSELESYIPLDFDPHPAFLSRVVDPEYKKFAAILNNVWKVLGKKLIPDVAENPQRYSMIPQQQPFIIPGERFHEFYYWDSFWIVKGLLISGMNDTARGIIENTLELVRKFGFVPNGARIYYLNRSQPPLLSEMVLEYYSWTKDKAFLLKALPILLREYKFWMTYRSIALDDNHTLNYFYSDATKPRPESYREDVHHSSEMDTNEAINFYADLAAGAESGEDFTSRWFTSGPDLRTIKTRSFVPVDLNAIMYRFEKNLLHFHEILAIAPEIDFTNAIIKRQKAIDTYLWNEEHAKWYDYYIPNRTQIFRDYPSNWFPLWSGAFDKKNATQQTQILKSLVDSNLIQEGGVLSTVYESGQQWDSPNAWAPHQSLLVQSLLQLEIPEGKNLAKKIATQWINANYIGFAECNFMREKYNAFKPGAEGGGGEYPPQVGFGWSNGVALEFLYMYGDVATSTIKSTTETDSTTIPTAGNL